MPIRLAISTCPNDTFAFHAILKNKISRRGLDLDIQLLDIQQLNDGLLGGRFDYAKASFHAAARLTESTVVLPSGSALGYGVGPLLLSSAASTSPDKWPAEAPSSRTLCPGNLTTATMLFHLFYGSAVTDGQTKISHTVFSDIMPALQAGAADFGVCIHEGRFTWQQQGLSLVADLGALWEQQTNCPLPLGGILANRQQPASTIGMVQSMIRESIEYALEHREETATTMRQYAQEMQDEVLFQHVDLYVDRQTLQLDDVGRSALATLSRLAKRSGLIDPNQPDISVWQPKDRAV